MLRCFSRVISRLESSRRYKCIGRKYSTPSLTRSEDISVPCRSNGFIKLRIHHPLVGSPGPSQPIIIYLPPGPIAPENDSTVDVASVLSSVTSATVVQINYRLSTQHRYPTCIHDVLRGYDWILEHLVPGRAVHRRGRLAKHTIPIAVCGELIGGGLATMLALTECRINGPCVSAAAVHEPLVDWVFPEGDLEDADDAINFDGDFGVKSETSQNSTKRSQKSISSFQAFGNNGILNADELLRARSLYFRKPADYFDPFASPMHFFRTSGVAIPSAPIVGHLDEFAELAQYEREDFQRQQLKLSNLRNVGQTQEQASEAAETSKPTRKSYRRWPGTASGLRIPDIRVGFGDSSPLSDQAVEIAMLFRRSIIAQNKKAFTDDEQADRHREASFALAEQKARVQATEGIQFWSDEKSEELRRVAQWLRQTLE